MGTLRPKQTRRAVSETVPQHSIWKDGRRRLCLRRLRVDSSFNCQVGGARRRGKKERFGENFEDFGSAMSYRWVVRSLARNSALFQNWRPQAMGI